MQNEPFAVNFQKVSSFRRCHAMHVTLVDYECRLPYNNGFMIRRVFFFSRIWHVLVAAVVQHTHINGTGTSFLRSGCPIDFPPSYPPLF